MKHFLSRGDFKPSNERVQIDECQISKLPVSQTCQQYESDSSITKEVHGTNLILLVFLDLKKKGNLH